MIKKIVVLAAGKGTRMLSLSQNKPKHLIKVKQRPFLYYVLRNIKRAGYTKIILVIGYKKEAMRQFVQTYKKEFPLAVVDQFTKIGTDKYGTALPLAAAREEIGNEEFVVTNGDDLCSVEDLKHLRELETGWDFAAGMRHPNPEHYGLLETDQNDFLIRVKEKPLPKVDFDPRKPLNYLINVGLYKFTPEIFSAIDQIKISPRGEYELTDALTLLAAQKKVKIIPIQGQWKSFTHPADVKKIESVLY